MTGDNVMKFGECLESVHSKMPLIHNITNYVTVNDVANVLLACGGSPIMADESKEVEDITSICGNVPFSYKKSVIGN